MEPTLELADVVRGRAEAPIPDDAGRAVAAARLPKVSAGLAPVAGTAEARTAGKVATARLTQCAAWIDGLTRPARTNERSAAHAPAAACFTRRSAGLARPTRAGAPSAANIVGAARLSRRSAGLTRAARADERSKANIATATGRPLPSAGLADVATAGEPNVAHVVTAARFAGSAASGRVPVA